MKTITSMIAIAATGCATAAQSAHTLAPGKTEISVSGSRNTLTNDEAVNDVAFYEGQVMVRAGASKNADVGFEVTRTTGSGAAFWGLSIDPKFRFTDAASPTTVSLGVPVGIFFADDPTRNGMDGASDSGGLDYGGLTLAPTLYVSQMVSPTAELLFAPRLYLIKPDKGVFQDEDLRAYFGGSIGVRITDPAHRWAVTPELAFTHINAENGGESNTLLTLGLGLSVGN